MLLLKGDAMAVIQPMPTKNGSNSLIDFIEELSLKHKNENNRYILPFERAIHLFSLYGPMINYYFKKKSPIFKNLNRIYPGLGEIRTKECRYFIYDTGENGIYIGLHGYEKQSQEIPRNEILKAKGEIQRWNEMYRQTLNHLA